MPNDRPTDSAEFGNNFLRLGTPAALLLAVISGGYTISTTDDRVRKAEVEMALQLRDARIGAIQIEVDRLRADVQRIDRTGPSVGNARLVDSIRDHESRLDTLEKK